MVKFHELSEVVDGNEDGLIQFLEQWEVAAASYTAHTLHAESYKMLSCDDHFHI